MHCKKNLGSKSSQDPDRRALYGNSWISIRGILIQLQPERNPEKIRMVENLPTILVFRADHNGGISLKNRKNFHLFYGTQSSNIQDLKIQIYFRIFFIYSWKGILCLKIFFYSAASLYYGKLSFAGCLELPYCLRSIIISCFNYHHTC